MSLSVHVFLASFVSIIHRLQVRKHYIFRLSAYGIFYKKNAFNTIQRVLPELVNVFEYHIVILIFQFYVTLYFVLCSFVLIFLPNSEPEPVTFCTNTLSRTITRIRKFWNKAIPEPEPKILKKGEPDLWTQKNASIERFSLVLMPKGWNIGNDADW